MKHNDWVYLDPDNRPKEPEGLHCVRCKKPLKQTQSFESFISVELHPENPWVRKSLHGNCLIGSECWNKIKNDIVDEPN